MKRSKTNFLKEYYSNRSHAYIVHGAAYINYVEKNKYTTIKNQIESFWEYAKMDSCTQEKEEIYAIAESYLENSYLEFIDYLREKDDLTLEEEEVLNLNN